LDDLRKWMEKSLRCLSRKSETAGAIRYALSRWCALTRYTDDERLEIDNSAADRALRAVPLGGMNYLFVGSDCGGERAAAIYRLIGTAKLNGLDPQLHLRTILAQIADYPVSRIGQLLPWNLAASLKPTHSAQARFNQLSYVPRRSTNKLNLSHRMSDFITSCIRSLLPFRCLMPVQSTCGHQTSLSQRHL
jgi:transposase